MAGIKLSELIQQDLVDDSSLLLVTNKDGRSRAITWGNLKSEVSVTGAGKYVASGTYENEVLTLNYNQGDPITITGFKDIDLSSLTEGSIPLKSTGDKLINSALSETSTTIISTKPIQTTEASLLFGETVKQSLAGREVTVTDLLTNKKFLTTRRYYDEYGSDSKIETSTLDATVKTEFQPTFSDEFTITAGAPTTFQFTNIYESVISSETFKGQSGKITFVIYAYNESTNEKLKIVDLRDYDLFADFGINDGTTKEVELILPFDVGVYAGQLLEIDVYSYDGYDAIVNGLTTSTYVGSNGTFDSATDNFVPYIKTAWQKITDDFVLTNDDSSTSADKSWSGLKIQQAIDVSATGVSSIIELPASYNDLTNTVWETVLADKASSAERATFVCYGIGSSYVGMPTRIILDPAKNYYIVSNVGASNDINDTMWSQTSWIVSDDDAYNANRFFRRSASTSALAIASAWSEYAKEEDVKPKDINLDASTAAQFTFDVASNIRNRNLNIYASTGSILGIVAIYINDFSGFVDGDTVRITLDKSYSQYVHYAVVYPTSSTGASQRFYVNSSLTIVKNSTHWLPSTSTSLLSAGIGDNVGLNTVSASNGDIKPIGAIVYKTDPAVSFEEQDGGTALKVDLALKQDAATAVAFNENDQLDLKSNEMINVTDVAIDNSGTISFYSQNHAQQSINFFNMGGLSLGAANGETIDFGFNGSVKQTVSESGIDMGSTKVTSLTDGTASTDAATCGQTMVLNGSSKYDAQGDRITGVSGIEFSSNGNSGNYADLGFQGASSRLRFFTSDSVYMTIGTESYASFDIFSSATQTYSFGINEFDMLNKPIKNLADGQYGNDAVNYSQLMTYQAGNTPYKVDSIAMGTGMTAQLNNDHQLTINAPAAMTEENQLLAGIAGGQLFVNEITVG